MKKLSYSIVYMMKYLEFSESLRLIGTNPYLSGIVWMNKAGLDALNCLISLSKVRRAIPGAEYVPKPGFRIQFEGNNVRVNDGIVYEPEYKDFGGIWGFDSAISVELTTGHSDKMLFAMYYAFDRFVVDFLDFDGKWYHTSGELRRFLTDIYCDIEEIHYRALKLYSKYCQL